MTALVLVDVQYDFLPPSGALAVPGGDSILARAVYPLLDADEAWDVVVASQDCHPPSHVSFASRHGRPPLITIEVPLPPERGDGLVKQELWPDHCVQGTRGCEFEEGVQGRLEKRRRAGRRVEVVRKGGDIDLDAYSAFGIPLPSPNQDESPLARMLLDASVSTLVVVGLATDFCVRATVLAALDAAKKAGVEWRVLVVREGVRGVFADKEEEVLREMEKAEAEVVSLEGAEIKQLLRGKR
ncbi:hypothetical protein JCM8547_001582 [Rhodosporidiobolus lusitaniae]